MDLSLFQRIALQVDTMVPVLVKSELNPDQCVIQASIEVEPDQAQKVGALFDGQEISVRTDSQTVVLAGRPQSLAAPHLRFFLEERKEQYLCQQFMYQVSLSLLQRSHEEGMDREDPALWETITDISSQNSHPEKSDLTQLLRRLTNSQGAVIPNSDSECE